MLTTFCDISELENERKRFSKVVVLGDSMLNKYKRTAKTSFKT